MNQRVKNIFEKQIDRGVDGFGLFDGQHIFRASKQRKMNSWFKRYKSSMIMFHHRKPTSTINVKRACHPFSTKEFFGNNQYITIHNGSIRNAQARKRIHEEEFGIQYQSVLHDGTFNDSEALAWDIALYLEGLVPDIKSYGNIAFIVARKHRGNVDKLYFGRNHYPLKMHKNKYNLTISSTGGKGEEIKRDHLYEYEYATNKLSDKILTIPASHYDAYPREVKSYSYQPIHKPLSQQRLLDNPRSDYNYDGTVRDNYDDRYYYDIERGEYVEFDYDESLGLYSMSELFETHPLGSNEVVEQAKDIVFNYLQAHDFYFEGAYESLEVDYEIVMQDADQYPTQESRQNVKIVEEALQMLFSDPEYKTVNSRSTQTWRKYGKGM